MRSLRPYPSNICINLAILRGIEPRYPTRQAGIITTIWQDHLTWLRDQGSNLAHFWLTVRRLHLACSHGINFWVVLFTRHTTPVRDDTVVNLPAGRINNYLTFGASTWTRTRDLRLIKTVLLPTELLKHYMVPSARIELASIDYRSIALPLS